MIIIFISENFLLDNIDNSELGIILVTTESDVINEYGLSYSEGLEWESSFYDRSMYKKTPKQTDSISLKFCLVDKFSNPLVWDDCKVSEVSNLFISDDFISFVSYDNLEYIYYLKATKISKMFNLNKQGYLEITFQPYSQYCYKKQVKTIVVHGEREINLINYSNVDDFYYPIITIKNLGDGSTINSIQNISINSEPLIVREINKNEEITIDNLMCTVLDSNENNRFSCQNRKWIKLKQNTNKLRFKGNCEVTIKSEFPIIV